MDGKLAVVVSRQMKWFCICNCQVEKNEYPEISPGHLAHLVDFQPKHFQNNMRSNGEDGLMDPFQ